MIENPTQASSSRPRDSIHFAPPFVPLHLDALQLLRVASSALPPSVFMPALATAAPVGPLLEIVRTQAAGDALAAVALLGDLSDAGA